MNLLDKNVKYLCDVFPEGIRSLVLAAYEVQTKGGGNAALFQLISAMGSLKVKLVQWSADQNLKILAEKRKQK